MSDKTYNGWTNYETWRVNLEIFDGWTPDHLDSLTMGDTYNLSQQLKDYAIDLLAQDCNDQSIAYSYALAFLDAADFRQIAQAMIDNHKQEA